MSSPVARSDYSRRERSRSRDYDRRRRHSPERSRRRSRSRDRFSGKSSRSGRTREIENSNEYSTKGQGPPRIEGMISLKVDNITHRTSVSQLKRLFSRYGELGDIYVPRYPDSNMTRGFAFVRYFRKRDAEEAMRKLDGERVDGRVLSIQMAKYARPSSSARRDRRERYSGRRRSRSRSPRRRRRSASRSGSRSRSRSRSRSVHSNHSEDKKEERTSRSPSPARSASPARDKSEERRSNRSSVESNHSAKQPGSANGSEKYHSEDAASDDGGRTNGKDQDWDNQSDDN